MIAQFPRNKMVAIPFWCVPLYAIFRNKGEWWYRTRPEKSSNATSAKEDKYDILTARTIVGLHINDVPKSLATNAKIIY